MNTHLLAASLLLPILFAACQGGDTSSEIDDSADAGQTSEADASLTEADAQPAEPSPAFTISAYTSGSVAVINDAILATYTAQGTVDPSHLRLSLTAQDSDSTCSVALTAVASLFGSASTSTRSFRTIHFDIGAATILDDGCGWDDDYMLSEFAARGTIEVGFSKARFPEDGPGLDLYLDRSWGLPGQTASIVQVGAAYGFAMDDQGVVDVNELVQPESGPLPRAVYQW